MLGSKSYKGVFKPRHPNKYRGDPHNIVFRSSWELKLMQEFDLNPAVLEYASEEIRIPYISPVDNRVHNYFPDFWVKLKEANGNIRIMLLEVKPAVQCSPPIKPKRMTQRFLTEAKTYAVNQAKWNAAKHFCKEAGWDFRVVTEKEIFAGK